MAQKSHVDLSLCGQIVRLNVDDQDFIDSLRTRYSHFLVNGRSRPTVNFDVRIRDENVLNRSFLFYRTYLF